MSIPEPRLIGYVARPTRRRTDWPKSDRVEEICSVSTCMSGCDWNWIGEWRHNEMWVFDSPELALGVVPDEHQDRCDLYAYQLFPVRFIAGRQEAFTVPMVNPLPLDASFEKLGFDLVSRSQDNVFECSPLSCNGLAEEVTTNRHCLLERVEDAFALAPTLEVPRQPIRGEPGPYFIVEVWRKKRIPGTCEAT